MPTIIPFPDRMGRLASTGAADSVQAAYDTLAPAYDAFTAGYEYEHWLDEIERIAKRHGLRGRELLDVACGTGKSFVPLLERGYDVTACDLSPAMVERARRKAPTAHVLVADMRVLPSLGRFDLVTCLDDALNYLLRPDELRDALAGFERNLAPEGIVIWDVNTLAMVRGSFSSDWLADRGEWFLAWHGLAASDVAEGEVVEARIDAFRRRGSTWTRSTSHHRQRHWPVGEVTRLAHEAGLEILEVLGQHRGARLQPSVDEREHVKALFVARLRGKPSSPPGQNPASDAPAGGG